MPLTPKGTKILKVMTKQYGKEKAEKIFYAMIKENKLVGVERKAGSKPTTKKKRSK